MSLSKVTADTLKSVQSIHQPRGFQTTTDMHEFWKSYGATGFLNIKEITPQMVREIREQVIKGTNKP